MGTARVGAALGAGRGAELACAPSWKVPGDACGPVSCSAVVVCGVKEKDGEAVDAAAPKEKADGAEEDAAAPKRPVRVNKSKAGIGEAQGAALGANRRAQQRALPSDGPTRRRGRSRGCEDECLYTDYCQLGIRDRDVRGRERQACRHPRTKHQPR